MEFDSLSNIVIGAAILVHQELGPGLLESSYEPCLAYELSARSIRFERQKSLPIQYKGIRLDCGYRLDMIVEGRLVLEIKAVEKITPIHEAQLLTYLRLSRCEVGLIINFNVPMLKNGLKRVVNDYRPASRTSRLRGEYPTE